MLKENKIRAKNINTDQEKGWIMKQNLTVFFGKLLWVLVTLSSTNLYSFTIGLTSEIIGQEEVNFDAYLSGCIDCEMRILQCQDVLLIQFTAFM